MEEGDKYVFRVNLTIQDQKGEKYIFRVHKTTPMGDLMAEYDEQSQ